MTITDKTADAQSGTPGTLASETLASGTLASQTLAFELDLQHPPQKVWRAITDPALLAKWLLPVVAGELGPDAAFVFQTQPYPGWDGSVQCRVLELKANEKLSSAWVVGDMEIDTVVTFTLTPTESGTRLSLVQSGFKPDQKQASGGARYGWNMMGGKLVELLATLP